jgi:hypothetical protein
VTARINYILVDFENVQPQDLGLLKGGPFNVKIFLGPNQVKIPVSLAVALQALGNNAEYIALETAGSNALDFHIAYYLGQLTNSDPSGFFHVISKDTGFDPLLNFLKNKKISVQRSTCIAEIPYFNQPPVPETLEEQVKTATTRLLCPKMTKPGTEKALRNTLNAIFRKELSESQLALIVTALHKRGVIILNGSKISYPLVSATVEK